MIRKIFLWFLFAIVFQPLFSQDKVEDLPVNVEFRTDTTLIEQKVQAMIDNDYSTAGMVHAMVVMEEDYDKLLNKYYKMLLDKMKTQEDKNVLIETQRNWIKFRDSEIKLIYTISRDTYTGGGTMWRLVSASSVAELTKQRLIEIYNYLTYSDIDN
ncbi:DUF1311 domain-containing protein [Dysgonomonas sp. OttesenSCG-928-M03]|nr:DUF1311 domain-containing protein [Dysgonomonas sp. OttesenSCG-928-M03]